MCQKMGFALIYHCTTVFWLANYVCNFNIYFFNYLKVTITYQYIPSAQLYKNKNIFCLFKNRLCHLPVQKWINIKACILSTTWWEEGTEDARTSVLQERQNQHSRNQKRHITLNNNRKNKNNSQEQISLDLVLYIFYKQSWLSSSP